uniref:DUF8003 domain-containing protein n=1 Tax=Globisporangium ultimum (strain ATCC 200006 / CBS 805.95 / DAOM BR144) TaxID=431595 RepID=K3W9K7_GLOUD
MASGVHVLVQGDDCILELSVGKMLLLQESAVLRASAISVDASFVRMESKALLAASYSGVYRNQSGLFTGSDHFGASHAGSGGRRALNDDDADASLGSFFDVRSGTVDAVDAPTPEDLTGLLHTASASWDLARVWTQAQKPVLSASNDDPSVLATRLLLGSGSRQSQMNSTFVSGGGRIRIYASKDLVLMDGAKITANGEEAVDGVPAGSGGSILLKASALSVAGLIQAKGGDAFCRDDVAKSGAAGCFPAGGGGRIHISYISSQLDDSSVDTTGGGLAPSEINKKTAQKALSPVQIRALGGGAGTYFCVLRRADGSQETRLTISNRMQQRLDPTPAQDETTNEQPPKAIVGGATTSVVVFSGENESSQSLGALTIHDGAIVSSHYLDFASGDLDVANNSILVQSMMQGDGDRLDISVRDLSISSASRILLPSARLKVNARSVAMDATSGMRFASSVHFVTKENLHLDANITSDMVVPSDADSQAKQNTKFLALESGGETILGGFISVGGFGITSNNSISITGTMEAVNIASAKSTFLPCNEQRRDFNLHNSGMATVANFTMVLTARRSISIGQKNNHPAILRAGAVLLCAKETIELTADSSVSANGMGELANQGSGSGECVGSVGGGGGYGGRGADSSSVNEVGDYAPGGLPYGTRSGVGMLGSGGGCVDGGSGGGVVMLGATGLILNGEIHCNGNDGANGAGGGSGGFLGLMVTNFLRGHGKISAVGGNSACAEAIITMVSDTKGASAPATATSANASNKDTSLTTSHVVPRLCGGGGGGGRLQLTGCEQSDFDKCTDGFDGNYTVAGGVSTVNIAGNGGVPVGGDGSSSKNVVAAAESGSFFGFPCAPGFGGLFCRPCKVGTYKSESNSEECLPCTNAPSNAHYSGHGSISADCDWTCDPGYSGDYCVSPLEQLLDACGGEIGFVLVILSIAIFSILLGYACRNRKEPKYARMYSASGAKGERQHLLSSAVANSRKSRFAFLFRCFYWPRVKYEKLSERDLHEHMARIYFAGVNDRDSPLKLRLTVPEPLKPVLDDFEFKRLAMRINAELSWRTGIASSWGEIVYKIVALLCFPFASEVLAYRRHIRVNKLKRIIGKYNHACMKGPRAKALQDAVKVGYSADYSLVYLELLNKESASSVCVPTTKIGKPSLPLVLLFAGCGTYYSPFYLDPSDLLVRSVPQCPELTTFIDEPWLMFVAELNALLRVVSREEACLVETLLPVAKFLERKMAVSAGGNGLLGGLRIYLGRFYVQDDADYGEVFKLGIFLTTGKEKKTNMTADQKAQRYTRDKDPGYGGYAPNSSFGRGLDVLEPAGMRGNTSYGNSDALMYDAPGWSASILNNANNAPLGRGGRRGSFTNNNNGGPGGGGTSSSSIREEALRIRSATSGSMDAGPGGNVRLAGDESGLLIGPKRNLARRRRTFYEGWLGPVDASMPVPGVLISADELEDRLIDRPRRQRIESFLRLHLLPMNVRRSSWLNHAWMLNTALLTLLMVDLAITFALVVNLKCVTDGEVDHDCTASVMLPVLFVPPLTLVVSPIMGIVTIALKSSSFSRRYSVWNSLSMINVGIALVACVVQSSRLVAPWFAGPLPLLPVVALVVKSAQSFVIERFVAYQETYKRRRGWRGLMKRRVSDASVPAESP